MPGNSNCTCLYHNFNAMLYAFLLIHILIIQSETDTSIVKEILTLGFWKVHFNFPVGKHVCADCRFEFAALLSVAVDTLRETLRMV